jgi:hypothetical protein
MRLSHTVTLALVGWYLMIPPLAGPGKLDTSAPLSKWEQDSAHDSAAECEQLREGMRYAAGACLSMISDATENEPAKETLKFNRERYVNARCISADDPRLKGD